MTEPEVAFACKKRGAALEKLGFVAGRHVAHVQIHGRKLALPFRTLEELDTDLKNTARRPK